MNYITSLLPDQIVHDIPNGMTNIPAIVTHIIDIEGEQWGCAYPLRRTVLKIERTRKRRIEIEDETIDYEMGTDTIWARMTIEGRTWMAVRKVYDREWVREGGHDDWYLERALEMGIDPDEILYPRKKRPVEKHVNPIPVTDKPEPCNTIAVKDAHTIENMLHYLSDSIDEHGRALFVGPCSLEAAKHAVAVAFPNVPVLTGKHDINTWYITPAPVVTTPKKRSKKCPSK